MRCASLYLLVGLLAGLALPAIAGDSPITLVRVVSQKVRYRCGEPGVIQVTLHNAGDREATVTVEGEVVQELALSTPLTPQQATLAGLRDTVVAVPFTAPRHEYGAVAYIRVKQGETLLAQGQDMFGVSDSLWNIAIGGGVTDWMDQTGFPWANPDNGLKVARAQYCNWWEKMFWAPDMFANLTPTEERWYSGQGGRSEVKSILKKCTALAKANGIASVTYSINTSGGPAAWEVARKHPEWYLSDEMGRPRGAYDTGIFAQWDSNKDPRFDRGWWYVYPDLTREDVLNHAVDELVNSSLEYGWDGVRFDGNFTWVGDDELGAYNQRRVKERLWAKFPNYVFGFNMAFTPTEFDYHKWSHSERECIVGGGHYMQEAIGIANYGYTVSGSYKSYRDYWEKESAATDAIRQAGASYHFIYYSKPTVPSQYKFMLGTADGTHPVYGDTAVVPGCANWGRYLTRWSAYVWDTNLRIRPDDDAVVTADVPLWHMVKARPIDALTQATVVHLVVPPTSDDVNDKEAKLGTPATNVRVRVHLPAAQPVTRAAALAPEHPDDALTLPVTRDGDWVVVTVPEVKSWTMLVIESAGTLPTPTFPKFTEAPDMARVEKARKANARGVVSDPLRPENSALKEHSALRVMNAANLYPNQAKREADPDAVSGACMRVDYTMSNSGIIDHAVFDSVTAGHYRATYRMKLKSKTDDAGKPVWAGFALFAYLGAQQVWLREIGSKDFQTPGKYETFSAEFDFLGDGSTINVGAFWRGQQAGGTIYVDTISLEQLSTFSDTELAGKVKHVAHAEYPLGGDPGLDVLVVNGLYNPMYRMPEALSLFGTVADATPKPNAAPKDPDAPKEDDAPTGDVRVTYATVQVGDNAATLTNYPKNEEALFGYDLVVLINADATWFGYQGRSALRDFVEAGGNLLVLGGNYTLGQGGFAGTYLADLLPVRVAKARDVLQAVTPLALTPAPTGLASALPAELWKSTPRLYWRHIVEVKPDAQVHLLAGAEPVLFTGAYGKGRVAVFTGTVLGNPTAQEQPFWQWPGWPPLMKATIGWLTANIKK